MDDLEDRIERYLQGTLGIDEARQLEEALLEPEVAQVFREVLILRELLMAMEPQEPPPGLEERIVETLLERPVEEAAPRRWRRLREAIRGVSETYQHATLATEWAGPTWGVGESLAGLKAVRYGLGPLNSLPRRERIREKPPLWRRILRRG